MIMDIFRVQSTFFFIGKSEFFSVQSQCNNGLIYLNIINIVVLHEYHASVLLHNSRIYFSYNGNNKN
jgi:hypothetical protein